MIKRLTKIVSKIFQNTKGMSITEIIAGITIATIISSSGAVNVLKYLDQARVSATINEMLSIRDALIVYQKDNLSETVSSVSTLVTYDYLMKGVDDAPDLDLETDYTEDAWNKDYVFVWPTNSNRGSITSAGPDEDINTTSDNIVVALEKIVN